MPSLKTRQGADALLESAAKLAKTAQVYGKFELIPLQGGRNNRVYRLQTETASYFLKLYFRHPKDRRNRLGTEFSFLRYAWAKGLRMVPQPIAEDHNLSLGLYEFLEGRKPEAGEIGLDHIMQALEFYNALNANTDISIAKQLFDASEACFCISDHLKLVEKRVDRLLQAEYSGNHIEAHTFVHEKLSATWRKLKNKTLERTRALKIDCDQKLSRMNRIISPSDFGFHNAILSDNNQIRFIDFEYAGWDDPAKMVCDFFCQPDIPVSVEYLPLFTNSVIQSSKEDEALQERINLLLPVYRIKWCCIMLNDFLQEGNARRGFSNRTVSTERKHLQLQKSRRYFKNWLETFNL